MSHFFKYIPKFKVYSIKEGDFMNIPSIIEKSQNGEHVYDIYSRLLKYRIIMLTGEIDDDNEEVEK